MTRIAPSAVLHRDERLRSRVLLWDGKALSTRLRLSLTGECNLGCFFCHNEGQADSHPSEQVGVEDYLRIVSAAMDSGITSIKLTGGEPLLYRSDGANIVDLVHGIRGLKKAGSVELSMTTNGTLLRKYATPLRNAGLDRITLSLHSLTPARHAAFIAKVPGAHFASPTRSLSAIASAGFHETKVNTVVFGDSIVGNVEEIGAINELCRDYGVTEHRLYTIIDSEFVGIESSWVRYWNDGLAEDVGRSLGVPNSQSFVAAVLNYAQNYSSVALPRSALLVETTETPISIEAMEPSRFSGISDEGPYALRLAANGDLSSTLGSEPQTIFDLKGSPLSHGSMVELFKRARSEIRQFDGSAK